MRVGVLHFVHEMWPRLTTAARLGLEGGWRVSCVARMLHVSEKWGLLQRSLVVAHEN